MLSHAIPGGPLARHLDMRAEKRHSQAVDYARLRVAIPPATTRRLREHVSAQQSNVSATAAQRGWLALLEAEFATVSGHVASTMHELGARMSVARSIEDCSLTSIEKAERAAIGLG